MKNRLTVRAGMMLLGYGQVAAIFIRSKDNYQLK